MIGKLHHQFPDATSRQTVLAKSVRKYSQNRPALARGPISIRAAAKTEDRPSTESVKEKETEEAKIPVNGSHNGEGAAASTAKSKNSKGKRSGKKSEGERPPLVRRGPVSNLKNVNVSKKRKLSKGKPSFKRSDSNKSTTIASSSEAPVAELQKTEKKTQSKSKDSNTLDDINPYVIGQRSRQLLENVWKKFVSLGSAGRASVSTENLDMMASGSRDDSDYIAPEASVTNVLVVGATGRVGRILVRKLQLRGYPVRVLVRPDSPEATYFPESVKVITGDAADYRSMRAAMQGVDKVIYVANARSTMTAEVTRVSETGVLTAAKALQDERNDGISPSPGGLKPFSSSKIRITGARQSDLITKRRTRWQGWQITHTGPQTDARNQESRARKYAPVIQDKSELWLNKRQNLIFSGNLFTRTSYATAKLDLDSSGLDLSDTVGLVVRVKGDKQTYSVVLTLETGDSYIARFQTTGSFQNIRIPYKAFRRTEETVGEIAQQLDPCIISSLSLRVDLKGQPVKKSKKNTSRDLTSLSDSTQGAFRLELNRIHALPAGSETDFILLSCAGVKTAQNGVDSEIFDNVLKIKRSGEERLRCSGLAYTVIRPGPIIDEPGGYKALVFDQGNRIQQSISRADVADVCVKSLHDPAARNKTFDVCHEYAPETGIEKYELVAHLPDRANSYLTPALVNLERET